MERLLQFFSSDFMAPHGFCFLWLPEIVWLHVIADALIAVSYFSIPLALWTFAKKRPDVPFNRIFVLFAAFITLCGLTHVFGIFVLWWPYYGIEGLVMLLTGVVSATTAVFVWKAMPIALTLPSPSELLESNEKLKSAYAEIEQKISDRTRELELKNAALIEARKKADEANRYKTDFLANMSHEIRTPMNVVMGVTEILSKSQPLTEKQESYLDTLRTSASSMLTLINDLLDIAKIESQALQLNHEPFSIQATLDEVVILMSMQARQKGLEFTLRKDTPGLELKKYVGDSHRIRQVLLNLVVNAIKFTEKGQVTLAVEIFRTSNEDVENVVFSVHDTGIGIPADKIHDIFNKFSQVDASITRKYGGTGLGLTITKNLVEAMGGDIIVSSEIGKGSTFTVTLPLQHDTGKHVGDGASREERESPLEKLRILLVEDYEANLLVVTALLDQAGCTYETARDGSEAIRRFQKEKFDVILMDVQMPVMDGLQATRSIRTIEENAGLPRTVIIGTTAHALREDKEKCMEAGMDDYLAKPYNSADLFNKIAILMKRQPHQEI